MDTARTGPLDQAWRETDAAVALFSQFDETLQWFNDHYDEFHRAIHDRSVKLGDRFTDLHPLFVADRPQAFSEVAACEAAQSGEYCIVSIEDGPVRLQWTLHSVAPAHVLVVIEMDGPLGSA